MKKICSVMICLLCLTGYRNTMAQETTGVDQTKETPRSYDKKDLKDLIEELLTYNPELKALVEDIHAAKMRIPQASALDDPELGFEASNIPVDNPSLSRTSMTGLQIDLHQRLPFPGKLRLKKKIAQSQETQAVQEYQERLNQLIAKFKIVFYDYAYTSEAILITETTKGRLGALTKSLEARYAAGKAPQQDVLKTKVETSKIQDNLIQLRNLKETLASRINTLLLRPPEVPLKVSVSSKHLTTLNQSLDEYRKLAATTRPWLNKVGSEIEENKHAHELAKRELLPDFDFSFGYHFQNNGLTDDLLGEDLFSTGVSINIPIWAFKKQGKKIAETRYQIRSAEQKKEAIHQEIIFEIEKFYYEINQSKEQYHLFASRIIPEISATLESSRRSYEAGEVDYLNVITNEMDLFNHRLMSAKYYYEHEKKIAELEMAIGQPIPSTLKLGK